MDSIFGVVQQNLNSALSIPLVTSAVTLGLVFYGHKAGPELPSFVEELFLNVFFQIFVGFMVLYIETGNLILSFIVSAVFVYLVSNTKESMIGGWSVSGTASSVAHHASSTASSAAHSASSALGSAGSTLGSAAGSSGNPFSGNLFSGNLFSGNPFSGNLFSGNPFSGNPGGHSGPSLPHLPSTPSLEDLANKAIKIIENTLKDAFKKFRNDGKNAVSTIVNSISDNVEKTKNNIEEKQKLIKPL